MFLLPRTIVFVFVKLRRENGKEEVRIPVNGHENFLNVGGTKEIKIFPLRPYILF